MDASGMGNGSTSFTDYSGSAHTLTANGNAAASTAQSKWGTASLALDGTGDYLSAPDSANWNFGTGNVTIEAWIRFSSVSGYPSLVNQNDPNTPRWFVRWDFGDSIGMQFDANNGGWLINCNQIPNAGWSIDTWYHVAAVRNGSSFVCYRDGTSIATSTASPTLPDVSAVLRIGSGRGDFNGYIDSLRITKGVARYTANFTPPIAAFPRS
jgi:hypothetical protein